MSEECPQQKHSFNTKRKKYASQFSEGTNIPCSHTTEQTKMPEETGLDIAKRFVTETAKAIIERMLDDPSHSHIYQLIIFCGVARASLPMEVCGRKKKNFGRGICSRFCHG